MKKNEYKFKYPKIEANNIYRFNRDIENGADIAAYETKKEENQSIYIKWVVMNDSIFVRHIMDLKRGMPTIQKNRKCFDFVNISFKYGVSGKELNEKDKESGIPYLRNTELRERYYADGIDIKWFKNSAPYHYVPLYRSANKAKKGEMIFVLEKLYDKYYKYITMGKDNCHDKLLEIMAYSSLISGNAVGGYISIDPRNILIIKDVDSFCYKKAVDISSQKSKIIVEEMEKATIKNTLFDGMGLMDESIFPENMGGFVYLRSHFFKSCMFRTNIQEYFRDRFGDAYETEYLTDMFGNKIRVKDIEVITTNNSVKWLKLIEDKNDVKQMKTAYRDWIKTMNNDNNIFAVVKFGHKSIYGDIQLMSYQMVNSTCTSEKDKIKSILATTIDYCNKIKMDDGGFLEYLKATDQEYNLNGVLIALAEWNTNFLRTDFYKNKRDKIINKLMNDVKMGRIFQHGDNLTLCGNPYGLLMAACGDDPETDPCFEVEDDAVQCYTTRFGDGVYLVGYRSPHNAPNNILPLHNHYSKELEHYFPMLGDQIIVVNGVHTDIQERWNSADYDSDFAFVTDQIDLVELGKKAYKEFPTVVNSIKEMAPENMMGTIQEIMAKIDNKISGGNVITGESSNVAQLALSHSFEADSVEEKKQLNYYTAVNAVLAQIAIDSAKKSFDVEPAEEVKRIKDEIFKKYGRAVPEFYAKIQKQKERKKKKHKKIAHRYFDCPMDILSEIIKAEIVDKRDDKSFNTATDIDLVKDVFKVLQYAEIDPYYNDTKSTVSKQFKKIEEMLKKYEVDKQKLILTYEDDREESIKQQKHIWKELEHSIKRQSLKPVTVYKLIKSAINGEIPDIILKYLFVSDEERFLSFFNSGDTLNGESLGNAELSISA